MNSTDQRHLDRCFRRLERDLPPWAARPLSWLRKPGARWVRIPLALLLMVGGCFAFLPVLGLWMLPLGIALLAFEIPPLQKPVCRLIIWGERKWRRHQRRKQPRPANASRPRTGSGRGGVRKAG